MAALTRRQALWLALAGAAGAGCASPGPSTGTPRAIEVAPGVYMLPGSGGAADADNRGRIGNAGFIVGPDGVVAVDTGTSFAHGRDLLSAIRATTDRPVRIALVSHTRPEFLFGGGAFQAQGVPVVMHRRCATLMAARCDSCLKALRLRVGEAPMAGTALYTPDRVFDATHTLGLAGRPLRVLHFGHSSGPGDIAVFDEASGTLFAGGLLDAQRVPDIEDSDFAGWRAGLAALRALPLRRVVPGHGPVSLPALVATVEDYLAQLESRVRALVSSGASLLTVADDGELPAFAAWDQYDTIHRRNASIAFVRFERELLFK